VKCTRPSAASALGVTVAALAAHIGEAEQAAAAKLGAAFQAASSTAASDPPKPSPRRKGMFGRSCGGKTNWGRPRSASRFIFSSPCSTAARGLDVSPAFRLEARLPGLSPA
jgi:hypothetical protein